MIDDNLARYHDEEYRVAMDPSDPRHLLPAIPPGSEAVLDVGCGAGQTLAALREHQPSLSVLCGIDIDAKSVAYGRRRWPFLRLDVGDGHRLPFDANSFDVVLSRVALPYMEVPSVIGEMTRMARMGGELWIVTHTWRYARHHLWVALRNGRVRPVVFMLYVILNGVGFSLTGKLFRFRGKTESFQTRSRMIRLLESCGCRSVTYEDRGTCAVITARKA